MAERKGEISQGAGDPAVGRLKQKKQFWAMQWDPDRKEERGKRKRGRGGERRRGKGGQSGRKGKNIMSVHTDYRRLPRRPKITDTKVELARSAAEDSGKSLLMSLVP